MNEDERINLVIEHHREARVELPNERIHAVTHVIVENQIALGDVIPVQGTVEPLMGEGLDRHGAIHAVGYVLANFIHELVGDDDAASSDNERYYAELKRLTAAEWLKEFQ